MRETDKKLQEAAEFMAGCDASITLWLHRVSQVDNSRAATSAALKLLDEALQTARRSGQIVTPSKKLRDMEDGAEWEDFAIPAFEDGIGVYGATHTLKKCGVKWQTRHGRAT